MLGIRREIVSVISSRGVMMVVAAVIVVSHVWTELRRRAFLVDIHHHVRHIRCPSMTLPRGRYRHSTAILRIILLHLLLLSLLTQVCQSEVIDSALGNQLLSHCSLFCHLRHYERFSLLDWVEIIR